MRIGQKLAILTLCTIFIIVLVAGSAYYCVLQLTESHRSVSDNATIMGITQELCFHLAYASAAQRAYVITDKDSMLDLYHHEIELAKQTINKLHNEVADNPEESVIVAKLERSVLDRMANMETTLQVFELKGREAAFNRIKTGAGIALMTKTLQLTNQLSDVELEKLTQHKKRVDENVHNTMMTIAIGSLLASSIIFISHLFISRNLSGAVNSLLRSSQNIAQSRFESLVNIQGQDELGDIGRAFNNLAGHLQEKAEALESTKTRLAMAQQDLERQTNNYDHLLSLLKELNVFVQESTRELKIATNYLSDFKEEIEDCRNNTEQSGVSMHQTLATAQALRLGLETIERKCAELNDNSNQLMEDGTTVSSMIGSICSSLPETKNLLFRLTALDNELALLDMLCTVSKSNKEETAQQELTALQEKLKDLRLSLVSTCNTLNINTARMQQSSGEAFDVAARFSNSIKNTKRPLESVNEEIQQVLEADLKVRDELINLERLHQQYSQNLGEFNRLLCLLEITLKRDQDFAVKLDHHIANFNNELSAEFCLESLARQEEKPADTATVSDPAPKA